MSEKQYRVIADRDKGDDPTKSMAREGDLLIFRAGKKGELSILVRIERPVLTTDEPQSGGIYDTSQGQCTSTITVDGGPVRCSLAVEHDGWSHQHGATLWPLQPSPHPPTREQIADALTDAADEIERILVRERKTLGMSVQDWLRQRAALIQNGADR